MVCARCNGSGVVLGRPLVIDGIDYEQYKICGCKQPKPEEPKPKNTKYKNEWWKERD